MRGTVIRLCGVALGIAVVASMSVPQVMSQAAAAGLTGAEGTCTCYSKVKCPTHGGVCAESFQYYSCGNARSQACDCKLTTTNHPCGDQNPCFKYEGLDSGNQCGIGSC